MDVEEYNKGIEEALENYTKAKNKLLHAYARSNNKVEVGDIVTDRIGSVKVELIGFIIPYGREVPSCKYWGSEITKKGHPFKNGSKRTVYQINLVDK